MVKPSGTMAVIEALQRGAILLLDEIDLASNKILCLQSILEGNGVFLKKIGKFVQPTAGFNVIATANTKGKGSDDGRFIGTNVLNESFLERFPVTFEQEYPTPVQETKIVSNVAMSLGVDDADFCKRLVDWATSSARLSMMVVLKKSSLPVVWFISSVLIPSLVIRVSPLEFV